MSRLAAFPMEEALAVLRDRIPEAPEVFLVLGSGLSGLAEEWRTECPIPFPGDPGFPGAGVAGHAGRLVERAGWREDGPHSRPVVSTSMKAMRSGGGGGPVRLAARWGLETVILTNAAGGISPDLHPGSILLLDDHINLMVRNPLAGPVMDGEERFPDMSAPYDPGLRRLALDLAGDMGIPLPRGVYAAVLGPML